VTTLSVTPARVSTIAVETIVVDRIEHFVCKVRCFDFIATERIF
jgi:hypothetical protein